MALHRLTQIVMGVPNVAETAGYYTEFGLVPGPGQTFATADGGEQLRIVRTGRRRLVQLGVGADDPDDLDRIATALAALDIPVSRDTGSVRAVDPGTEVTVQVSVAPRLCQEPAPAPAFLAPEDIASFMTGAHSPA